MKARKHMQISRHWRMNSQRYRLQGIRYEDGTVSLQNRPCGNPSKENEPTNTIVREDETYLVEMRPLALIRDKN